MFRILTIAMLALGLVGCGEQGPSLEGKWAWFDAAACEGDRDTMEFSGVQFFHRQQGEVVVEGTGLAYRESDAEGSVRLTAVYGFNGRVYELTFEPSTNAPTVENPDADGGDILIFRGSAVDGVVPPAAARAAGRILYRCE